MQKFNIIMTMNGNRRATRHNSLQNAQRLRRLHEKLYCRAKYFKYRVLALVEVLYKVTFVYFFAHSISVREVEPPSRTEL
jgi:hypothetical protein